MRQSSRFSFESLVLDMDPSGEINAYPREMSPIISYEDLNRLCSDPDPDPASHVPLDQAPATEPTGS